MRKVIISTVVLAASLAIFACGSPAQIPASQSRSPQYYSPLQNAQYVSKDDSIIVRYGPALTNQDVSRLSFTLRGSESGLHDGQKILADDGKTVIFKPNNPFVPGEEVKVDIRSLNLDSGASFDPLSYTFMISVYQASGTPGSASVPNSAPKSAFPDFLTVPQDIPHYTVQTAAGDDGEGYIFVAPFYWTESTVGSYLLILNNRGQLVYYKPVADELVLSCVIEWTYARRLW